MVGDRHVVSPDVLRPQQRIDREVAPVPPVADQHVREVVVGVAPERAEFLLGGEPGAGVLHQLQPRHRQAADRPPLEEAPLHEEVLEVVVSADALQCKIVRVVSNSAVVPRPQPLRDRRTVHPPLHQLPVAVELDAVDVESEAVHDAYLLLDHFGQQPVALDVLADVGDLGIVDAASEDVVTGYLDQMPGAERGGRPTEEAAFEVGHRVAAELEGEYAILVHAVAELVVVSYSHSILRSLKLSCGNPIKRIRMR